MGRVRSAPISAGGSIDGHLEATTTTFGGAAASAAESEVRGKEGGGGGGSGGHCRCFRRPWWDQEKNEVYGLQLRSALATV